MTVIGYRIRATYANGDFYFTGSRGCPRTACRLSAKVYKTRQAAHLAYWMLAPKGIACGDSFWVRAKVVRIVRRAAAEVLP